MRVFQSSYKDRNGQTQKSKKWYVEFLDHNRRNRRTVVFADKKLTEQVGRKIEKLVEMRLAGETPGVELTRWLDSMPVELRTKLASWDLLDSKRTAAGKPLSEHLDDFKSSMMAKGDTAKHAQTTIYRVRQILDGCGFIFWADISASRVDRFLSNLQNDTEEKKGISKQTRNYHLTAIKSFCRWMVQDRRASESPVAHLKRVNARTDRKVARRALTVKEITKLLRTASGGPERHRMTGAERSLLYRLALETGLRAAEIKSLTRRSFDLNQTDPTVTVAAAYAKNRREDSLPLKRVTAALLQDHLRTKLPDAPAFTMPARTAEMLRADLKDAGIPSNDDAGRVVDFHALRHTFASLLAASGVHPKTAQTLLRHGTIDLTMSTYTHSYRDADRDALSELPGFDAPTEGDEQATGTTDAKSFNEDDSVSAVCSAESGTFEGNSLHHDARIKTEHGDSKQAPANRMTLQNKGKAALAAQIMPGMMHLGPVAELADAADLKSAEGNTS